MILRGMGTGTGLIIRGLNFFKELIRRGGIPKKWRKYYSIPSRVAREFIAEVKEKIMETGVVKDTHKPYNPRTNKRYQVPEHRADVIAWNIAKEKGLQVGSEP